MCEFGKSQIVWPGIISILLINGIFSLLFTVLDVNGSSVKRSMVKIGYL